MEKTYTKYLKQAKKLEKENPQIDEQQLKKEFKHEIEELNALLFGKKKKK